MWEKVSTSLRLLLLVGLLILLLLAVRFERGIPDGKDDYERYCGVSPGGGTPVPAASPSSSHLISSSDGLAISVSGSGGIDRVKIDQNGLPLLARRGGFSFREVMPGGRSFFGPYIHLNGTTVADSDGKISQRAQVNDMDFSFTYIPRGRCIEIKGDIQDRRGMDRALQISFNLPVNADGWKWGDYIRAGRRIRTNMRYENTYIIEPQNEREERPNRTQSVYPFASIDNGSLGLGIAVPMDVPRIYRTGYSLNDGYSIQYDIGLSNQTQKIGKGHATFTFIIYRLDEPDWGFRSAAKKYYELYPQFFEKRNTKEGTLNWLFPQHLRARGDLSDFGLAFDISSDFMFSNSDQRQMTDLYNGISPLQYTIPWDLPRDFPGIGEEPAYEEKTAALEMDMNSSGEWNGVISTRDAARAVFNTAPYKTDGTMYLDIPSLKWSFSGGTGKVWYPTNPDPELPLPNRYDMSYRKYIAASEKGLELGGISVDNVIAGWLEAPIENYRIEHYKYADFPLVFSYSSRKPVMLELFSNYEYLAELRESMLTEKKLIHANTFPDAYNFFAHLIDILGGETGASEPYTRDGWDSTDITSSYRRTLSYQKTNVNIYTAGWAWKAGRNDTENYIKHSLFYAIFPGSSSGNFFVDSNRDLFRKYIPVIRKLSQAGWEPIPYASVNNEDIMLERYGYPEKNNLHYALRNRAGTVQRGTVIIDMSRLGAANAGPVQVKELVSGNSIDSQVENGKVVFDVSIEPHDTLVFRIG